MHDAVAKTLTLSGNGSKWRPLDRGSALYNQDPMLQQAAGPRGLLVGGLRRPNGPAPSTDLLPAALSGLTAT
jgi:hypothetical protein